MRIACTEKKEKRTKKKKKEWKKRQISNLKRTTLKEISLFLSTTDRVITSHRFWSCTKAAWWVLAWTNLFLSQRGTNNCTRNQKPVWCSQSLLQRQVKQVSNHHKEKKITKRAVKWPTLNKRTKQVAKSKNAEINLSTTIRAKEDSKTYTGVQPSCEYIY